MAFVVDGVIPQLLAALRQHSAVVLHAPPGTGKTTRVPPALMHALADQAAPTVIVLEPRRLAARLAATWVARQEGCELGERVGYQVRFESRCGEKTRLLFVTEALLVRRMLSDPCLAQVGAVILDEFHERHLSTDLALMLLRRLQLSGRPDLKLVVMSATLDPAPLARYFGGCPVISAVAPQYDVALTHLPQPDRRPLHQQVGSAVRNLLADMPDGDLLVFLPGAAEIRRAIVACEPHVNAERVSLLPLYGSQRADDQDRALAPNRKRKVIFSTNVAESSLTVPGVRAVIDSGLHKLAGHASWSGMPTLTQRAIPQASAIQRAGRAGREAPGVCVRLYTAHDLSTRRNADEPELHRADLSETLLLLHALGVNGWAALPWFDAPQPPVIASAQALLGDLGAVDVDAQLTPLGRQMSQFALHPRQSRLLLAAAAAGIVSEGALAAALLSERDLRRGATTDHGTPAACDLWESIELFREAHAFKFDPRRCAELGIEGTAARSVHRVAERLQAQLKRVTAVSSPVSPVPNPDLALRQALLLAYPDRVARRQGDQFVLSGGRLARPGRGSVVRDAAFLVALDAEESRSGGGKIVTIERASAVEPEWLVDAFAEQIAETLDGAWDAERGRAVVMAQLRYRDLVIDASPAKGQAAAELATTLLRKAVDASPIDTFFDPAKWGQLACRVTLVRAHAPAHDLPPLTDEGARRVLLTLCEGRCSLSELLAADPWSRLLATLGSPQLATLRRLAPDEIELPGGRRLTIHYEPDKPPWTQSRLQDFFGLAATPTVCGGRVPVVLHLLAPNRRAVQVTSDLAGFWQRHYPELRRQLQRRYPKHAWPEDGATATPPPPGRLR